MEHTIAYFSFWDVPRTFVFENDGKAYLLTSEFDDHLDEYPDFYEVFVIPGIENLSPGCDWKSIESLPRNRLGTVPVASVKFDKSRRKYVDASFLASVQPSSASRTQGGRT